MQGKCLTFIIRLRIVCILQNVYNPKPGDPIFSLSVLEKEKWECGNFIKFIYILPRLIEMYLI
jgi:hypothetical protein